ncbi:MAG: CehA/McbA family metallohydrolase [Verrucomicrobiales bacterium]
MNPPLTAFAVLSAFALLAAGAQADQASLLHSKRIVEALSFTGQPLSAEQAASLASAKSTDDIAAVLDPLCIAEIQINPESRVKVAAGRAKPILVEAGWAQFLVKVINDAGVTAPLKVNSPQAIPLANSPEDKLADRWLEIATFDKQPLTKTLTGAALEYRILQLYSRDSGKRAAALTFDVGQGTQDLGFRSEVTVTFDAAPAESLTFSVFDEKGAPTTAAFEIRDARGRVYPSQAKRLAPDFHFHPQIYRAHGEVLKLPAGQYMATITRGPEYYPLKRPIEIVAGKPNTLVAKLRRWIDPAELGWWSGDHHIHAAGCAHYTNPTEGVHAPDMLRHCIGEDLKVGSNLTWGPCFDYQKQFFTGKDDEVSTYPYLLRYDVEVSGFGSHQSGHLCLLRLKDQIYPGGDSKHHWPTLCLNTLRWAKAQGGICGPAHSGWGLITKNQEIPNYEIPPFDGIGANEYIVDVTHTVPGPDGELVPAVDFISTVDTPIHAELNIWYHTLNVGFRTRISGETDFPCIYGERVGLGRSYVKVDGELTYDKWCRGIQLGRNYTGDGRSHLIDFTVNDTEIGTRDSTVNISRPSKVNLTAKVAALLDKTQRFRVGSYTEKPYWHIERARVGAERKVPIEVIVNGLPVSRTTIDADGTLTDFSTFISIEQSSWVALRILGSSHTNPIWVIVDDQPVRASKQSAEWCLESVDRCWSQKQRFIKAEEMEQAKAAYQHARETYLQRIVES